MNWSAPIDAKKYTSAIEICLNIWIWMRKEIVSIQGFDGVRGARMSISDLKLKAIQ